MAEYKEAIDTIGAAADAMTKIVDGIKHLVITGTSGYNYVSAKRDRKRLIKISARATILQVNTQAVVVRDLDEYLNMPNPSVNDWNAVTGEIASVIKVIKELLDDVKKERSDFVLESAYSKLLGSMNTRAALLSQISALPPPSNDEKLVAIRELNAEYKRLLNVFREAIEQLNLYLKRDNS